MCLGQPGTLMYVSVLARYSDVCFTVSAVSNLYVSVSPVQLFFFGHPGTAMYVSLLARYSNECFTVSAVSIVCVSVSPVQ